MTPLQKARHALRIALKKAAQELFSQDSSKQLYNTELEYEDSQEDMCEEEESFDLDWMAPTNDSTPINLPPKPVSEEPKNDDGGKKIEALKQISNQEVKKEDGDSFGDENQDGLMTFTNDSCQENSDSFSTPFLSMPDLDPVPTDSQTGAELLAEFNIDNDIDEGITRKLRDDNEHGSLNCVLPSISQDQNDYAAMSENNVNMDQYNGEWDQMFNDMINRSANQECGSELKELYSQISKTIDLLNS